MLWKKGWWIALNLGFLCWLMMSTGNVIAQEPAEIPGSGKGSEQSTTPYTAPSGAYSLNIPSTWESTWSNAPNDRTPSELQLVAPDQPWPEHVTISVFHYASAYRTSERYLFDLQNPSFGGKDEVRTPVLETMVAGIPAKAMDVANNRYPLPGMSGETIPALIRYIVVPASHGFFVLRYDVPQRSAAEFRMIFDRLVDSFAPADSGVREAHDQIPASEYEVYTAFFKTRPPQVEEPAQLFSSLPDCRLVKGQTLMLDNPVPPPWQGDDFNTLESALIEDYNAKNQKTWHLTDKIMVPDLVVISPEELDARLSDRLWNRDGMGEDALLFRGGIASLSRVGFNGAGNTALLDVAITYPGAMRARYLVLMQRQEGTWTIARVALESFIYH